MSQQIPIGTTVTGELSSADPTLSDGSHYKLFTFTGTAGQTVQIDLMSSAFDSYLYLRDQSGQPIAHDDDGGGGLNARIVQQLPYTGTYQIVANTLQSGQFGAFTLQLQGGQGATMQPVVSSIPTINSMSSIGQVGLNQQVQNTLVSGGVAWNNKPIHLYGFQCSAGQPVQIDILSSWDNYLIVFDPSGTEVAHDDDGGEGLNARLRWTCPTTGLYRLGVTTGLVSTTPGAYTLQVQATGQPMQMIPAQPHPAADAAAHRAADADGAAGGRGEPHQRDSGAGADRRRSWPASRCAAASRRATSCMGSTAPTRTSGSCRDRRARASRSSCSRTTFPTYLQLLDAIGHVLAESAGHPNSGLAFTLPATGHVPDRGEQQRRAAADGDLYPDRPLTSR